MGVINNPQDKGLTADKIYDLLSSFKTDYFCMAKEISETGTEHFHFYVYRSTPMTFNMIKKKLPYAHIEIAYGSHEENIDYVNKEGKWKYTDKVHTKIEGSFRECGERPIDGNDKKTKFSEELWNSLKEGKRPLEIIEENPSRINNLRNITTLHKELLFEKNKNKLRNVTTTYIYGKTGLGKTHYVYHHYNPEDIYVLTNYNRNNGSPYFDNYSGEQIMVWEEFHGQIPIGKVLTYLDIYPVQLPARYNDVPACYEEVLILSNLSLHDHYADIQISKPEVWNAFLRRIDKIYEFYALGKMREINKEDIQNESEFKTPY